MPDETDTWRVMKEQAQRKIARLELELAELRAVVERINHSQLRLGRAIDENIAPVNPGVYKGQRVAVGLFNFLKARKESRFPLLHVVKELMAGEVNPGKPRGKRTDPAGLIAQSVKIALQNGKEKRYGWQPAGKLRGIEESKILLWLLPGAEGLKLRPKNPKKNSSE
jgi:hypothetical protein